MLISKVRYLATKIRALLKQISPLRKAVRELRQFRILLIYNAHKVIFHLRNIWNMVSKSEQNRQKILTMELPVSGVCSLYDLEKVLKGHGIDYVKCRNTLYIPPQCSLVSLFGEIVSLYPDNAGFKILRNSENLSELNLLMDKIIVANYLYLKRITPRLYDLVELRVEDTSFIVFVVQHVNGDVPTNSERLSFMESLKKLIEARELLIDSNVELRPQENFQYLGYNGDVLKSKEDKQLYCLDFQNFTVAKPKMLIQNVVTEGKDQLLFGGKRFLRGDKYVYQSIPSVGAYGKRDVEVRWKTIKRLLNEVNINLDNRLVLDIGCNAGMMLSQALADGAYWGLGWDRPLVVEHSQRLLMALGYTRFDLKGVELTRDYNLLNDIQTRFISRLDESVIFYLAVRLYFDFMPVFGRIPWKVMIYEGHKGEKQTDLSNDLRELYKMCPFSIASSTEYNDGDSHSRALAVLIRN